MCSKLCVSGIGPPHGSHRWCPLPSPGPLGTSSPASSVLWNTPTSSPPSDLAPFGRSVLPPFHSCFASWREWRRHERDFGVGYARSRMYCRRRDKDLSGSQGIRHDMPCSTTPAHAPPLDRSAGVVLWSSASLRESTCAIRRFRGSVTRPVMLLCTLRSAGYPGTAPHSLLSRAVSRSQTGLAPAGFRIRFPVYPYFIGLSFPAELSFPDARGNRPGHVLSTLDPFQDATATRAPPFIPPTWSRIIARSTCSQAPEGDRTEHALKTWSSMS
mgnify:CR=1 FL=1